MTFGTWLSRERELRGITLAEVAEETKLSRATLEAIEADDGRRRPERTYLVGTLRAVAEVLGLDPDDVVLRYEELEGPLHPPKEQPDPRARSGGAARRVVIVAAGAALMAAAGLLGWSLLG